MSLPEAFEARMRQIPGLDADAFLETLKQEPLPTALRLNPLRPMTAFPGADEPVPWCPTGWYVNSTVRPGQDPLHDTGAFYLQEASAMAVAEAVSPEKGMRILDLCAAPGGKAGHLGGKLAHTGFLLANEIVPDRARLLSSQLERLGIRETAVTNERPDHLAERFGSVFDRVLVDAPCSGEGMFRKDAAACEEWTPESNEACARRQQMILDSAAELVRPGGWLVYSTCTFSILENEQNAAMFLRKHPDFEPLPLSLPGWQPGLNGETHCARLWPHLAKGEGHFIARFLRIGGNEDSWQQTTRLRRDSRADGFWRETMMDEVPERIIARGSDLWYLPEMEPEWGKLRLVRSGIPVGTPGKGWFKPTHTLVMACQAAKNLELDGDLRLPHYMNGEEIRAEGSGWTAVTVKGCPLGWGKISGGRMKNHLPTGLRRVWQP